MAMSLYYVDPASGNDTTGDGTIGTPWKSVQKALDTITRNSTDGDQINVKAGAADTLTAALTLATYGTPTFGAPLVFRGYTSAADDGGIGEINGNGTYGMFAGAYADIHLWDMKLGNSGTAQVLNTGFRCSLVNCEIYGSSNATGAYFGHYNKAVYCLFHSLTGTNNVSGGIAAFVYCTFRSSSGLYVLYSPEQNLLVAFCHFDLDTDTTLHPIYSRGGILLHNTVYNAQANQRFPFTTDAGVGLILNNIATGASGTGGSGFSSSSYISIIGGNADYNNATVGGASGKANYVLQANLSLSAMPYVDAANDDFRIATDSDAIEAAWPSAMRSMASTTNAADIGAVQRGAGSGGGIIRRVMRILGG